MFLWLVRHASYYPKMQDPGEGLSPEGKKQAQVLGKHLKSLNIAFDKVFSSPKLRARQTAKILLDQVGQIEQDIYETPLITPGADPHAFLVFLNEHTGSNVLIVSHLPFIGELTKALTSREVNFETATCCKIEIPNLNQAQAKLLWLKKCSEC